LTLATMDEETAQSCFYALPRKDKDGNKVEITQNIDHCCIAHLSIPCKI